MNSVCIDSAVAATPIYIGPNNASSVVIGNANCSTNINGLTYLARNTTGANPTYFEMVSGTSGIYMDFHSNSTYSTDFDARISCNGGTSTYGQGGLELNASTIALIGTSNIGVTSSSNSYIGNGTSNSNGIGTGVCSINKLQVGNTAFGSGVANGTAVRCIIYGINLGASTTSGTVTIPGAPTGAGNPIVFASINITTTTNPYFINVNVTGTNTFVYYKSYLISGDSVARAATVESFNYMAIWF